MADAETTAQHRGAGASKARKAGTIGKITPNHIEKTLAWASILLPKGVSSLEAELTGLIEATHAALSWALPSTVEVDEAGKVRRQPRLKQ